MMDVLLYCRQGTGLVWTLGGVRHLCLRAVSLYCYVDRALSRDELVTRVDGNCIICPLTHPKEELEREMPEASL